jgi:hypothetical protein
MRVGLERVLRAVVIAALALMLWRSTYERSSDGAPALTARDIDAKALTTWTREPRAPRGIHVQLSHLPNPIDRAWLGALAGAGSSVTWNGEQPAVMVHAEPVAQPRSGTRIDVATPKASAVVLSDAIGVIDTVRPTNIGASVFTSSSDASVAARTRTMEAATEARDSVLLRKVLVIGGAGWESKFVIAALEEAGWKVDALIRTAPNVEVIQGAATQIDTSRYSAVVALDGSAAPYADRILAYVRGGGGAIIEPPAAALAGLVALRAGTAIPVGVAGTVPVSARRIVAGRALQVGSDDTWKLRMSGGEESVRAHRAWWTDRVSSVAYAPAFPRAISAPTDEAPLVDMVATLGQASARSNVAGRSGSSPNLSIVLFTIMVLALIGEVGSRRVRGAA